MPNNSLVIFKEVMQYIFWPFAFLMGVYVDDCQQVSKLIGYKVFVNEFFAYDKLGKIIKYRQSLIDNGSFEFYRNGIVHIISSSSKLANQLFTCRYVVFLRYISNSI